MWTADEVSYKITFQVSNKNANCQASELPNYLFQASSIAYKLNFELSP
jgi:hypothetical protein